MIPAAIEKIAARCPGKVGRAVDSTGKHIAYWYEPREGWRVYRGTARGMVHLLHSAACMAKERRNGCDD